MEKNRTYFCLQISVTVLTFLAISSASQGTNNISRKTVIGDMFDGYDSRIPPNIGAVGPVNVTVQVYISSIDTISETNMDFTMGMFLRTSWYDSRLAYTAENLTMLELDVQLIQNVWVPDLYMPAEKKATLHEVTVPNKLMHIYSDGKIQYSMRISAVLKCNFDLRKFPLDSQHCVVEMESYGYTRETLAFKWHENPIQIKNKMKIPQFTLLNIEASQCDRYYYGAPWAKLWSFADDIDQDQTAQNVQSDLDLCRPLVKSSICGTIICGTLWILFTVVERVLYSCVKMDLFMARDKGYYITQVYLPSFLIVFLSWVSFWLDIDAVPARISLGLLTVLTMTTQSSGARANLPKVSYVKAIDIWMAVCLIFVFLALVQFAYVNVLSRVEKRRKTSNIGKIALGVMAKKAAEENEQKKQTANGTDVEAGTSEGGAKSKIKLPFDIGKKKFNLTKIMSNDREKARNVDRISRILFPCVFFIFNIIYWCVYVFWIPTSDP